MRTAQGLRNMVLGVANNSYSAVGGVETTIDEWDIFSQNTASNEKLHNNFQEHTDQCLFLSLFSQ